METFWKLFERSVVMSGFIVAAWVIMIFYLVVNQMPIPELVTNGGMLILGYFFGSASTKGAIALLTGGK